MIEKSKILLIAGGGGGVSVVAVGSYLHYEYGDKYDGKSRSQWKHLKSQTDAKLKFLKHWQQNPEFTYVSHSGRNHELIRIFEAYAMTYPDKIDQFIDTHKSCVTGTTKVFEWQNTHTQAAKNYICSLYALTGKKYDSFSKYSENKEPEYQKLLPLLHSLINRRSNIEIENAVKQDIEDLKKASDYFESESFKITDSVPIVQDPLKQNK